MIDDYKDTWQKSQILLPFIAAFIIYYSFTTYTAWAMAVLIFVLGFFKGISMRKSKTEPDNKYINFIMMLLPFIIALFIFFSFNDFRSWVLCAFIFIIGTLRGYEARRMKEEGKTFTGRPVEKKEAVDNSEVQKEAINDEKN